MPALRPRRIWAAVLIAGSVLATGPAAGQTISSSAERRFFDFATQDEHMGRAVAVALEADANLPAACPTQRVIDRVDLQVLRRPLFREFSSRPHAGSWLERWAIDRCGEARIINLFFTADPAGVVSAYVGIPGETETDPVQQREAVNVLLHFAQEAIPDCAMIIVDDSVLISEPVREPGRPHGAWAERWWASGCGARASFQMVFDPESHESYMTVVPDQVPDDED